MAKRKKQARRQQKQRRRAARIQQEKHRRQQVRGAGPGLLAGMRADTSHEVLEDVATLLPGITDERASESIMTRQLMTTLLESEDLADEPEFEPLVFDPLICVQTFVEVATAMGIEPQMLMKLDEEERENVQMDMLVETGRRLLTEETRREILDRLNTMRLRLKQSGEREKAARAAVMQSFLSSDTSGKTWIVAGLVRALVSRSLAVGFELYAAVMEIPAPDQKGSGFNMLKGLKAVRRLSSALRRIPGLRDFLERKTDQIWEEGLKAIYEGNLYLELFTEEELAGGLEVFRTALGLDKRTSGLVEPTREQAMELIARMEEYVTRLFTPERLRQLQARVDAILQDPAHLREWVPFLILVKDCISYEDAIENEKWLFVRLLLGEIRVILNKSKEQQTEDG